MPDNGTWLMRPVARGWCKYESLIDGTLDLADIAFMNDAIAVEQENERRVREWYKRTPEK